MLDTSIIVFNILESWDNAISILSNQKLDSDTFEILFSLRLCFHLAEDIHQPLNCTMLWNLQFPNEDYGETFLNYLSTVILSKWMLFGALGLGSSNMIQSGH